MDVLFWPFVDLMVFGFLSIYMLQVSNAVPALVTFLIGAAILWNVFFRSQQAICIMFLDDVWSRNLLNVFAGPIRASEYVAAAYCMGLLQSTIVVIILGIAAALFYGFNLLQLGSELALLYANLLLAGCWIGLLSTGFILRWGPPAEALGWVIPFLIQPVSAVFYPVSVLPKWMQVLSQAFPLTYVFEGMRQILKSGRLDVRTIWCALFLNLVYMVITAMLFRTFLRDARRLGFLAKYAT
jgi:ABC-2 type transport system permease protein